MPSLADTAVFAVSGGLPLRGTLFGTGSRTAYAGFLFHCVRHEGIARSVLLFQKEVTTPAVLPAVPYRGVRRRRRRGAKTSGQRILTREGGDRSASRDRHCQHRGGRGPWARGTANPGEPPQAP